MREKLASRLGFLMLAAGSAVGLGNVWRFPYVVGENGGAAFVLVYLAFLVILGAPMLAVEFSIGRASGKSLAAALGELSPPKYARKWKLIGSIIASGCFILMIYYTDIAGWLLKYTFDYATFSPPKNPGLAFDSLLSDWKTNTVFMLLTVLSASAVCMLGVVKGIERATKWLMLSLLAILGILAIRSLTLSGAAEGLSFYLKPDWGKFMAHPLKSIFEAMGQAFFTLSLGIGSMTICASYIDKKHSLVKESFVIILIDTLVALISGLVIFPACATYGIDYTSGPGLIFVALPKVFAAMPGGSIWSIFFFLFLAMAALTTVIAVFECLIAGLMDTLKIPRSLAAVITLSTVATLSMPCILWEGVLAWEDFAVSQIWLPIGALTQCFFVINGTYGWGWGNFREQVSCGKGWDMPKFLKAHYTFVIPLLILSVLIIGIIQKF